MIFSITIPAYKTQYLRQAIESVIVQNYQKWELIIVDDCSPEDLKSIVEPYLQDTRIQYYRNEKNCGAERIVDNWNICLSYCTGDYVICMGDDDILMPNALMEYKKMVDRYPSVKVIHGRTEIIDENGEVHAIQQERPEWESALSLVWNRWDNRNRQYIGDFCYHTASLREEGGYFFLPLAWGSDDITAVRAAEVNGIANINVPCFRYRENRYTITNSGRTNARKKAIATIEAYQWYQDFLVRYAKTMSEDDQEMMSTISGPMSEYFFKSLWKNCEDDVVPHHPFRIFYWYRILKQFNYPAYIYLKRFIAGCLK